MHLPVKLFPVFKKNQLEPDFVFNYVHYLITFAVFDSALLQIVMFVWGFFAFLGKTETKSVTVADV